VKRAAEAGVAGLSIEDRKGNALLDVPVAVERLRAARAALDAVDPNVVLVGRSEGYLVGVPDLAATIGGLKAYAEAGGGRALCPRSLQAGRDQGDCGGRRAATRERDSREPADAGQWPEGPRGWGGSVGGILETASLATFEAAAWSLSEADTLPATSFG
jgi:hypothetical protein